MQSRMSSYPCFLAPNCTHAADKLNSAAVSTIAILHVKSTRSILGSYYWKIFHLMCINYTQRFNQKFTLIRAEWFWYLKLLHNLECPCHLKINYSKYVTILNDIDHERVIWKLSVTLCHLFQVQKWSQRYWVDFTKVS